MSNLSGQVEIATNRGDRVGLRANPRPPVEKMSMRGVSIRVLAALLALVATLAMASSGCTGDTGDDDEADDDLGDDDAADDDSGDDDDDAQPPALALGGVEPPSGGASVTTRVTLSGEGFFEGMTVQVGDVFATNVVVESGERATADFLPVPAIDCGRYAVTVRLVDQSASLPDAFEYIFDEDPIVFVHGWTFGAWEWETMIARFRDLGYPEGCLAPIDYDDPVGSNIPQARDELAPFVDEVLAHTGAEKVDVVAHSAGGLSSRLWIKQFGGGERVRDYVSLSGTHHGTVWSCAFTWTGDGAAETCPAYADQEESVNGVQWDLNGDPDAPDVDETPFGVEDGGGITWNALWTDADLIDIPPTTSCLNQQSRNDCSDSINVAIHGVGHIEMATDPEVFQIVLDRLRAHNVNRP